MKVYGYYVVFKEPVLPILHTGAHIYEELQYAVIFKDSVMFCLRYNTVK